MKQLVLLLSLSLSALTQAATLEWESELCRHKGQYDAKRYSQAELLATYDFIRNTYSVDTPHVFTPADLSRIKLDDISQSYQQQRQQLQQVQLVKTPFWQQQQQQRLDELKTQYEIGYQIAQAHLDPKSLLTSPYAKIPACLSYVKAVTEPDQTQLKAAWRALVDLQKQRNGFPQELERKFQQQSQASDWQAWARVELITFGVNNCWLEHRTEVSPPDLDNEFLKLLTKVKTFDCVEP